MRNNQLTANAVTVRSNNKDVQRRESRRVTAFRKEVQLGLTRELGKYFGVAPLGRVAREYTAHCSMALILALSAPLATGCDSQPKQANQPSFGIAIKPAHAAPKAEATPVTSLLKEGSRAPDATLTLQDGFDLNLALLRGKLIALYFCSTHDSPACLREAQGWRKHWSELHEGHQIVMVGISPQGAAAHRAFIAEQKLQFDLATDADGRIAQAFKLPTGTEYGPYVFLIGKDGKLRKSWATANPDSQAQEMLAIATE